MLKKYIRKGFDAIMLRAGAESQKKVYHICFWALQLLQDNTAKSTNTENR